MTLITILQAAADTLSLALSGVLAYYLRTSALFPVDPYLLNPRQYLFLLVIGIGLWHFLIAIRGGYSNIDSLFRIEELHFQFKTSILLFLLLMAGTFLYKQYDFSRLIVFFSWFFFVFLGSLGRQIAHRIRESLHRRGLARKRVLLAGSGEQRELFENRIRENAGLSLDIVPFDTSPALGTILATERIDEVFLFQADISYEEVWRLREQSVYSGVVIHFVPPFGNLFIRDLRGGFFDGAVMISVTNPNLRRPTLFVKRGFDVLVSALFLVLCAPLMLLLCLLIRIDSRGPILFRQRRIGRDGAPFTILKFRTMYIEVDAYAETPTDRADPRITRCGRLLRSTGLDELPQLWNVLIGDMSLVGPRPEMPFIVEAYDELQRKRLKVRPGITGLWQVYARTANLPIHRHIEYDLFYIENLSFSLDLMIILDTIPTLVLRTGI